MLELSSALKQAGTNSVRNLRLALSSQSKSVRELLKINLIHNFYLSGGGRNGAFGLPTSDVQFNGTNAIRQYRGGEIHILENNKVQALPKLDVSVRYLGFKCITESDELSESDEPYFVITVDAGSGAPVVKLFKYTDINKDTEIGEGELLIDKVAPNPMVIRVLAYERDEGKPEDTAKEIQAQMVMLSQEAGKLASAAGAADGPGVGTMAPAGSLGGIVAGPLGALVAVGIVSLMGLGDDFIGQNMTLLFESTDNVGTPPYLGEFQGAKYNRRINVKGDGQGNHDLFFDIRVNLIQPPVPQ